MTAGRGFQLLVGLAAMAILGPLVLAYRLLPCGDVGGLALHAVGAACHLLGRAGLQAPLPVGVGLTSVSAGAVAIGLLTLAREVVGAHRLTASLEAHPAWIPPSRLQVVVSRAGWWSPVQDWSTSRVLWRQPSAAQCARACCVRGCI